MVARNENENPDDITYYHVEMSIQAPNLTDDISISLNQGTVIHDWIKTYCSENYPKTEIINGTIRRDKIYWKGRWYTEHKQSNFLGMGGSSYYEGYCVNSSDVDYSMYQTPPPQFNTEYTAFQDAVGQLTMVVEMAYLPLINKLENL